MKSTSYLVLQTLLDNDVARNCKFSLHTFEGEEGICKDFSYQLHVSSLERLSADDINRLMGQTVTVKVAYKNRKNQVDFRYINGVVFELIEKGMNKAPLMPKIWQYVFQIGPWLKKLDFVTDCRIFQKDGKTSLDIITDLLIELGFRDFRNETRGALPFRNYTVLYNETISNFIRRLLQREGLIWRYEHTEKRHELVFYDNHDKIPEVPLHSEELADAVQSFNKLENHCPVKNSKMASYNWQNTPAINVSQLTGSKKGVLNYFDYAIDFKDRDEGEHKNRRFCTALKRDLRQYIGQSTIRSFSAGQQFTLFSPTVPDLTEKKYLLRDVKIKADATRYSNHFIAMPVKQEFLLMEDENVVKPKISGLQTAVVVGHDNDGKVKTDRLGRVKVRFHWDHHSPNDSNHTSAFIRVAMPGAGFRKGFLFVPRVGEEVLVKFIDGDPEKPMIIGSLYSRINPPPFKPNKQPFKSMIRNSSGNDSNQVMFDDKPEAENLELVAKKDMLIDVTNNLDINVVNNINITAKSIFIVDREKVRINAGNNIANTSMATIINMTAQNTTNTAVNNRMSLALGTVYRQAGGAVYSDAGVFLANTSAMGIRQTSERLVSNVSKALVTNTGAVIINNADETLETKSGLAILNNASENTFNKTDKKQNKIDLISSTESGGTLVKGKTTIGP